MNLDELQSEVERLLKLLNDRQPGLVSWNIFLDERLNSIFNLLIDAGWEPKKSFSNRLVNLKNKGF